MANEPISKTILDEMYNFIQAGISAATAALPDGVSKAFSVKQTGVSIIKDIVMNPNDNSYQRSGRIVGNTINGVLAFSATGFVKNLSIKTKASAAFTTSTAISQVGMGDIFANLYNTYIANADAFYSKILTDSEYANQVWNGIIENGLSNYVTYFDPDRDGIVSADDIVNGYKQLFSPPPEYGSAEFEILYSTKDISNISIKTPKEYESNALTPTIKNDEIKKIILNDTTYDIKTQNNLIARNAIDYIPSVSFLLSNITFHADEKFKN